MKKIKILFELEVSEKNEKILLDRMKDGKSEIGIRMVVNHLGLIVQFCEPEGLEIATVSTEKYGTTIIVP